MNRRYTFSAEALSLIPDLEVEALPGEVPDPADPPAGCHFHPRCPLAEAVCREIDPSLQRLLEGHLAASHVAARAIGEGRTGLPQPEEVR